MTECNSVECNSVELTYYQKNRSMILNRAKGYYENDKEILREQARDKYRNLSEEDKNKRREYGNYDTAIFLKKINKDYKNIKKILRG